MIVTKRPKNTREARVHDFALSRGWQVLHKGWPDFLLIKGDRIVMVEVKRRQCKGSKSGRNGMSDHQKEMKRILEKHFEYKVIYI